MKQLLFPQQCILCQSWENIEQQICSKCRQQIHFINNACSCCGGENQSILDVCSNCIEENYPWESAYSIFRYNSKIQELIHMYKYQRNYACVPFFANALQKKISQIKFDLIICIPLTRIKEILRSFNQNELLLSYLKIPFNKNILKKKSLIFKSQATQDKKNRKKQLLKNFYIKRKELIKGCNILLIDDVFTTGATLKACSKLLLKNGAKSISVLTLAR